MLDVIRAYNNNPEICKIGCIILWNISEFKCPAQQEVCEKKGLNTILELLETNEQDLELTSLCFCTIGIILSSQESYSKFCTQEILGAIKKYNEEHKDSEELNKVFLGLIREEDPKVKEAVSKGVCTKDMFPKCGILCGCDEGFYCPNCWVQQKVFRCYTCDKDKNKFYCESCWKRDHKEHDCAEFFFPVRCDNN